ncbi:acyl-homoserine-lactone synthase [Ruegeria sp. EL01]|jgi:N-acyl-L-homoserine lactone synthetase|uniref:acyl-homoserine-lactone synthase n=1 Tax=Ruegeria sp. EL01 TaxID=2107578 RepID=UPI000EA7F73A|nr:acyl-homoserine-lactone synthase [Ruegeria sp. EL01]
MQSIAVDFSNIHQAGNAWNEYWQLRKDEFVDKKGWELPHTDTLEFDWYDRPGAQWIIVMEDGHCVGGSRLLRTDAPSYGQESYMLKDAQDGLISGIPVEMIPADLPRDHRIYEATRFFVRRDLSPKKAMKVQREIVCKTATTARSLGGEQLVALMPCKIYRIFRRFGFEVVEHDVIADIDGIPHTVGWLKL